MVDVSIIIVNWNTSMLLKNCLSSIFNQNMGLKYEVIVVDNASEDGSVKMVKEKFPTVKLVQNTKNIGFAAGNNIGMKIATGRYILLLNPDTIILDNAIHKTVMIADNKKNVAVLGCQVWLNEKKIQKTCFRFPSIYSLIVQSFGLYKIFPHSKVLNRNSYCEWDRKTKKYVDVISGMYMLVRKKLIKKVGLMDEDYFVYAEETDWCYRFYKAGYRCMFTPKAKIIHCDGGGKSTQQISVKMYVQMQKSILIFFRKQKGYFSWLFAKYILIFSMIFKLFYFYLVAYLFKKSEVINDFVKIKAALKFHFMN